MADIKTAQGIGIHPSVAPAEFRQVCDYLNGLIKTYGGNFEALNTAITDIEDETDTTIESIVHCSVSSDFDTVYDNAGTVVTAGV